MEGHDFYLRFLMVQLLPSLMMIWLFMTYKWAVKEHSVLFSYQFIEFDIFSYVLRQVSRLSHLELLRLCIYRISNKGYILIPIEYYENRLFSMK